MEQMYFWALQLWPPATLGLCHLLAQRGGEPAKEHSIPPKFGPKMGSIQLPQ